MIFVLRNYSEAQTESKVFMAMNIAPHFVFNEVRLRVQELTYLCTAPFTLHCSCVKNVTIKKDKKE
jgi:hypothetical protein